MYIHESCVVRKTVYMYARLWAQYTLTVNCTCTMYAHIGYDVLYTVMLPLLLCVYELHVSSV